MPVAIGTAATPSWPTGHGDCDRGDDEGADEGDFDDEETPTPAAPCATAGGAPDSRVSTAISSPTMKVASAGRRNSSTPGSTSYIRRKIGVYQPSA